MTSLAVAAAGSTARLRAELCDEQPRLIRYARYLTRDETNAWDLVQTAFARALSRLHLFASGTDLRAWLFTIVHNEHVNRVRREVRRGPTRSLDGLEHGLAVPADQLHRIEMREVSLAVERLPREQRDVIMLVAVEGHPYEEVAAMLDVPIGTVRSRLSRARESLRRAVQDEC
jgi:RNA polymerase sigma-70 factor (ECF subfamily)